MTPPLSRLASRPLRSSRGSGGGANYATADPSFDGPRNTNVTQIPGRVAGTDSNVSYVDSRGGGHVEYALQAWRHVHIVRISASRRVSLIPRVCRVKVVSGCAPYRQPRRTPTPYRDRRRILVRNRGRRGGHSRRHSATLHQHHRTVDVHRRMNGLAMNGIDPRRARGANECQPARGGAGRPYGILFVLYVFLSRVILVRELDTLTPGSGAGNTVPYPAIL